MTTGIKTLTSKNQKTIDFFLMELKKLLYLCQFF